MSGTDTKRRVSRVLIVDDDPTVRRLMASSLAKEGITTEQACDGAEALTAVERFRPHLVLLDVKMPGMDGFTVCSRIRSRPEGRDVTVVMVTGLDDRASIEESYRVGATDFIAKPIRWPTFNHRVLYLLRARAAFVQLRRRERQLREKEGRLHHMAHHDALTALPNRVLLDDRLEQAIHKAHRMPRDIALLFIDFDRFKQVNDTLGHAVGDRLLQGIAERLRDLVREGDTLARLGGDEFVLLLDDMEHRRDAGLVARKIIDAFQRPIPADGHDLFITCSIGISLFPQDGEDPDTLLRNADVAMYKAKDEGRDTFRYYTEDLTAMVFERMKLESSLRSALDSGQLYLCFQPQVELAGGGIAGAEALLRWRHPEIGAVPPRKFIPLAEDTGLISPIGKWVLRSACGVMRRWRAEGMTLSRMAINVNVSGKQLRDGLFARHVTDILEETGLEPEALEIEITEKTVMRHPERTIKVLSELRDLGVGIAVDDFGTGYSCLSYLKRLPISKLKIDQSFVQDIPGDPNDTAITRAVIALGRSMGLAVVAEGVESPQQERFLKQEGCDFGQGYLYSRPLQDTEFESMILGGTAPQRLPA